MAEYCAYCGDKVYDDAVKEDGRVFCCEECLDAYNDEALLFLEEEEQDDL